MDEWDYPDDLVKGAWALIANAYDGDWSKADPRWVTAAEKWRDAYHEVIDLESGR